MILSTSVNKIPKNHTRNVFVGIVGSSLLETVAATSGMGEFSSCSSSKGDYKYY